MAIMAKVLTNIIFLFVCVVAGYFSYWFYNRCPLSWFMDSNYNGDEYLDSLGAKDESIKAKFHNQNVTPNPRMKKFPDFVIYISSLVFIMFIFYLKYDISLLLFCNLFTLFFLSLLFVADIKTQILPDQFIFGLFFVSLFWLTNDIFYLQETGDVWYNPIILHFLGGMVGGGILFIIHLLGSRILKQEAMGMGDIKLVCALGVCIGITGIIWIICMSFIFAFIPALISIIKRGNKNFDKINPVNGPLKSARLPFAPFIVVASALYLFIPDEFAILFDWYSNLKIF